jgi:phosphoribosyl-dephospho-CoA transferase
MNWKRHTMVDISDSGREAILAELAGTGANSATLKERLGRVLLPELAGARIPGIVRREEAAPRLGCVPVGFSEPISNHSERLRLAAFARLQDVVRAVSPYEVISLPIPQRTAGTEALIIAKARADSLGLTLGVWGSAAMELFTGLPCTRKDSDLDLLVAAASEERLSLFMAEIETLEERFSLRIDVEVDLPNGYGVQMKELLGEGHTVLGKSIADVALLPRDQTLAELPHNAFYPLDGMRNSLSLNGDS